jgi:hypothetical protein
MAGANSRKPRRKPVLAPPQVLKTYADGALPVVDPVQVESRIAGLFTRRNVADMFCGPPDPFRQRLLTIEVMVLCMLQFVLVRMPSFLEVVTLLRQGKIADIDAIDVSAQAFYKRLAVIPHQLFLQVLQSTSRLLKQQQKTTRGWVAALASFATGIYAIDDTSLDALVRRTEFLKKQPKGDLATLGGRLACAIDLVTGKFEQIVYDADAAANEKSHVRPLISALPQAALLVFDLGYFSFSLFDWLTVQQRYFVTRMRAKTSFKTIQVLADRSHYRDRIVWLGNYRADRAAHPVRLVEIQLQQQWWGYVTNVMEPSRFNAAQIWGIYSQRWTIEMCFAAIKRALRLAYLRPSIPNAMLTQIWSTLTVYQVLQDLRLDVAAASGWHEDDVSWEMLMRRIGWYAKDPPNKTLREWLCSEAEGLSLKKRGVRKRRLQELPPDVLAQAIPPPPDIEMDKILPRTARQGDPHPLKNPSKLVKASLS